MSRSIIVNGAGGAAGEHVISPILVSYIQARNTLNASAHVRWGETVIVSLPAGAAKGTRANYTTPPGSYTPHAAHPLVVHIGHLDDSVEIG